MVYILRAIICKCEKKVLTLQSQSIVRNSATLAEVSLKSRGTLT